MTPAASANRRTARRPGFIECETLFGMVAFGMVLGMSGAFLLRVHFDKEPVAVEMERRIDQHLRTGADEEATERRRAMERLLENSEEPYLPDPDLLPSGDSARPASPLVFLLGIRSGPEAIRQGERAGDHAD